MDELEIRRLINWNRTWWMLCVVGMVVWGALRMYGQAVTNTRQLHLRWAQGGLKLSSAIDGPFLVTHLVRFTGDERDKAVAQLPEPLAIIDSGGAIITREVYRELVWKNYLGTPVAAPTPGTPLHALYSRPSYTLPAREGH